MCTYQSLPVVGFCGTTGERGALLHRQRWKESAANRIKAAELILARAEGLPARASEAGEPPPTVEEWLEKQEGQSRL